MMTVFICGLVNSGLVLGLLAGIGVGFVRARVEVADALLYDPFDSGVMPARPAAVPA